MLYGFLKESHDTKPTQLSSALQNKLFNTKKFVNPCSDDPANQISLPSLTNYNFNMQM